MSLSLRISQLLLLIFLAAVFTPAASQLQALAKQQTCLLRCVAFCLTSGKGGVIACEQRCKPYGEPGLCSDEKCWRKCRDFDDVANLPNKPEERIKAIDNFTYTYDDKYMLSISWNPVPNADIYVIVHWTTDSLLQYSQITTTEPYLHNFTFSPDNICTENAVQIVPISGLYGSGPMSEANIIPPPRPQISPRLKLLSMVYEPKRYFAQNYEANGTITITFQYEPSSWPLGDKDLEVVPMFHMMLCAEPDLTQAVPVPEFTRGPQPHTVQGQVGSDMMYRKCKFIYSIQDVRSKQCDVTEYVHAQTSDFGSVEISCDNVQNSECYKVETYRGPVCGQIDRFNYDVLEKDKISWNNKASNISVNISFTPYTRPINSDRKPLYYVALYGDALPYDSSEELAPNPNLFIVPTPDEETLLGVNMTNVLGKASNCLTLLKNNTCLETVDESIILTNLTMDKLYGVMICGVMDPRNLTFPSINVTNRAIKTKANRLVINSKDYKKSKTGMIIGIILGLVGAIVAGCLVAFIIFYRKQKRQRLIDKLQIQTMKQEIQQRYVDMPKKNDLWELERRNLIIYDDKKLGSGAFGAVYLAKLIGKAEGSKDAQSTLGINLMRAENCLVAVKMLPEYADDLSKSEFLREIGLMKTLGYHERLVNMLACVTESEPYCLVVEYCSDGDLLHFLRERCKYMLKLDEQQIDYSSPECEVEFDVDMIMTVKQLLQYAVQISYGLEYLSQKGFVHRDVAARNVLVHERNYAKIGDFGLCRYIYAESSNYKSKGGRLPIKWMSPEAIRHYEFTTKSDVWSFGILMFEIITLGGTPYPGIQPDDMLKFLETGNRINQPDNCPDDFYQVMKSCWATDPATRPDFSMIRQKLATQLEEITDEYSYLKLDAQKDYYNVSYKEKDTELSIPSDAIVTEPAPQKPVVSFFKPVIPPRASELNSDKRDLEHNDSGVSIELDSDQYLMSPRNNNFTLKAKDNSAYSDSSDV